MSMMKISSLFADLDNFLVSNLVKGHSEFGQLKILNGSFRT